jgi:hypothetical protein
VEIVTETAVAVPPGVVWDILTDFARYAEWNPFIVHAEGVARAGTRLTVRIEPPGGRGMTFRPTVLAADPGHELRWLGRLVVPGLFDGEHRFVLEASGGGVRLVQAERFRGLLVPLLRRQVEGPTRRGFEAMNAALKARAEAAR